MIYYFKNDILKNMCLTINQGLQERPVSWLQSKSQQISCFVCFCYCFFVCIFAGFVLGGRLKIVNATKNVFVCLCAYVQAPNDSLKRRADQTLHLPLLVTCANIYEHVTKGRSRKAQIINTLKMFHIHVYRKYACLKTSIRGTLQAT